MLILALLASSAQCLARCNGLPCHQTEQNDQPYVPPCHRQQRPAKTASCEAPMVLTDRVATIAHVHIEAHALPVSVVRVAAPVCRWGGDDADTLPNAVPQPLVFRVLRI